MQYFRLQEASSYNITPALDVIRVCAVYHWCFSEGAGGGLSSLCVRLSVLPCWRGRPCCGRGEVRSKVVSILKVAKHWFNETSAAAQPLFCVVC
eukprot:scaffold117312_cov39-Attheya_sp.AAC.1